MNAVWCVTLFLASLVTHNDAARILAVNPSPSISHQVVFRPIIQELIKKHEVVYVTADPMYKAGAAPKNLIEIDVHDISYATWKKEVLNSQVTTGRNSDIERQFPVMFKALAKVFAEQVLTDDFQKLLNDKTEKFDLLLLEAFYLPLLGLSHIYKAPVIQIASFGAAVANLETVGAPIHPFVYPALIQQKFLNLSIWEKITEMCTYYRVNNIFEVYINSQDELVRRLFGPDTPSLNELRKNVDMLFLDVHPMWDSNRPYSPNVVFIGGIHQEPQKELPKDIKNYLDSSKNGVIYVSFGTNIEPALLPPGRIQAMINVLSKLPYDILWKWNQDELPGRTENIRISKWLPQPDLLRHPKVKLFITQGGLQSTDEAITAGVPLVGIPMLGDQWFNVEMYVYHKIGVRVDMETLTEERLDTAVQTVLKDKSYRDNIIKLRSVMQDQPQTPLQRATWWTEYVLRHGGAKHLRSPAANMSLFEYYEVKLVLFILLSLLSVIFVVSYTIWYLYCLIFKRNNQKLKSN